MKPTLTLLASSGLPGIGDESFTVTVRGEVVGWVASHKSAVLNPGWTAVLAEGGTVARGLSRKEQAVAALVAA